MMPKHKHMLEVLLEDQQINIQDENLLTCVSLLELSLCVTMGDNKAAMNSSSTRENHNFVFEQNHLLSAMQFKFINLFNQLCFDLHVKLQHVIVKDGNSCRKITP